jgi:hypothetical membrane protein
MKNYNLAIAYILVCLVAAHLAAPAVYDWRVHSISQLGAQAYPAAWITRLGFTGFGALVLATGAWRMRLMPRFWYREVPVMLYGLAILLSGFFSTAPFIEGVPYSPQEARLHSICATAAGAMLTLATLLYALTDTPPRRRLVHWMALALITGISLAFGALPAIGGILQRLLWVVGFAWLLYLGTGETGSAHKEYAQEETWRIQL